MRIKSELTLEEIEELYKKKLGEELLLPLKYKRLNIGVSSRLIQLLITRLKLKPDSNVRFLNLDIDNKDSIKTVIEEPHCLSAILMAKNVISKNGQSSKRLLNGYIAERLDESFFKRRRRLQLFAVDHSIRKYSNPLCFYKPEGSENLRHSGNYGQILRKFITSDVNISKLNTVQTQYIGEFVAELIDNTDHHAREGYLDGSYDKSIRGVIIDYKLITKGSDLELHAGRTGPLKQYLDSICSEERPTHLLEFTIFDSGQGIYHSFNDLDEVAVEHEYKVVSTAFSKGITSKSNGVGYGRGLHNVRKHLNNINAYIGIRTGRLSLYRNFKDFPLIEGENEPLTLFDEKSESMDVITPLYNVHGAAYTILVPLK